MAVASESYSSTSMASPCVLPLGRDLAKSCATAASTSMGLCRPPKTILALDGTRQLWEGKARSLTMMGLRLEPVGGGTKLSTSIGFSRLPSRGGDERFEAVTSARTSNCTGALAGTGGLNRRDARCQRDACLDERCARTLYLRQHQSQWDQEPSLPPQSSQAS